MEVEIKTWLSDIRQAVAEINSFLPDQKNFLDFQKDIKAKRAIERNVEIIGEAANRILRKQPNISITDVRKIIDTRDRIVHGYDSVSDDIIWSNVIRHLPRLAEEVEQLLK